MIRLTGICLVLIAGSGIGFALSHNISKHLEALLSLKKIIMLLKGEILYLNSPLEEGFLAVGERVENPYQEFLFGMADDLSERSGRGFYEIWCQRIDQHLNYGNFKKKDLQLLKALGENLGFLDKDMQEKNLNLYLAQLEEEMEIQKGQAAEKSRVYRALGIMGGILVVIVMI